MNNTDYYFGLDIGTNSIGAAVTDEDYNLLKYKGNAMWFVKLFDESKNASERRGFRSATRRLARKRERINCLQMLFNTAIAQKDPAFFRRLKESNLYQEDKSVGTPYAVFDDPSYNDADFHKQYPTIYHLRKELIENPAEHDVRLVYLALHHLIKHRGHFLFDSLNASEISSFKEIFSQLQLYLSDEYEQELVCNDYDELADILKNRSLNKNHKYSSALKICRIDKKSQKVQAAVMSLICGKTEKASELFQEEITDADDKPLRITLSGDYDKNSADYAKCLGDRFELIEQLKAVYDWSILADILSGEKYISFAKVKTFEKHKNDLIKLKKYVKENCPEKYKEVFKESSDKLNNYTAYSGKIKSNGKTGVLEKACLQEDFCGYLKKQFKDLPQNGYEDMFEDIENNTFMPKQHISDNGVIPIQINETELEIILSNSCKYLSFLNEADENGKTVADKIHDIFRFRIPYYVGPLNRHSDKHWLERKDGKIYPWNFTDIVDIDKSAENFINNLTSKCTYLPDKDVIPKNSVLYCKYMVLNEINNLRVNGEKISVELKQNIYRDLFLKRRKVTKKALEKYFRSHGYDTEEISISGIKDDVKASMKPYLDLAEYGISEEEMDLIVTAITIFGDDKRLLKKRLHGDFDEKLSNDAINKISRLKYSGWGRLSKEFLCDIYGVIPETGEVLNIINALWETNDNLMILLGSKYNFMHSLKEAVHLDMDKSLKEIVDDLYVSPAVKRPILQSVKMLQEVVKVMGKPPKKIFVEMTRGEGKIKKEPESRKDQLTKLYKACKMDCEEIFERLESTDNERLRSDKLYLYYTQFGKCMYTGESINFDSLFDKNIYDIDHIFPRSKVKDDSLNNRVLVKKQVNAKKDNDFPLSGEVQKRMYPHWKFLLDKGLIEKEKFDRLIRKEPLSDEELSDFISRQLVETSQSTKAVAQILEQMYPQTAIVYVKARNVSGFRDEFDMYKCRAVNDLHHAKDAYLNIVVGNVYDVLYTRNKANFIKGLQTKKYSLNTMFSFEIKNAWKKDGESLRTVKKTMNKNNVIYTRYSFCRHGTLFDRNPLKKGRGQAPLTSSGARSSIEKYGGYNKAIATYFTLVKHKDKKGKQCLSMVPINLYQLKEFETDPIEFLKLKGGLNELEIINSRIKCDTCISVDGFRMHITSKSGHQIKYKPAMQLVIGYKYEKYVKGLSKYWEKYSDRPINESDHISSEENTELFDLIIKKMTETIFKVKFGDMGTKILKKRDKFVKLSAEKQCFVLLQILTILHSNASSGDLRYIGLTGQAGIVTTSTDLSGIKGKVRIINQSVTGLFESYQEIN